MGPARTARTVEGVTGIAAFVYKGDIWKNAMGTAEAAVPTWIAPNLTSLFLSQLLEEAADGFDPAVEVGNVELLVGGVEVIVR